MNSYPAAPAAHPCNALLTGAGAAPRQETRKAVNMHGLLAGTIGHAAALSDTPVKWETTIAMLKRHGVDPAGFEDFKNGRLAAMSAAGLEAPGDEGD